MLCGSTYKTADDGRSSDLHHTWHNRNSMYFYCVYLTFSVPLTKFGLASHLAQLSSSVFLPLPKFVLASHLAQHINDSMKDLSIEIQFIIFRVLKQQLKSNIKKSSNNILYTKCFYYHPNPSLSLQQLHIPSTQMGPLVQASPLRLRKKVILNTE